MEIKNKITQKLKEVININKVDRNHLSTYSINLTELLYELEEEELSAFIVEWFSYIIFSIVYNADLTEEEYNFLLDSIKKKNGNRTENNH